MAENGKHGDDQNTGNEWGNPQDNTTPENMVLGGVEGNLQQYIQKLVNDQLNQTMAAARHAVDPVTGQHAPAGPGTSGLSSAPRFNWGNITVPSTDDMVSIPFNSVLNYNVITYPSPLDKGCKPSEIAIGQRSATGLDTSTPGIEPTGQYNATNSSIREEQHSVSLCTESIKPTLNSQNTVFDKQSNPRENKTGARTPRVNNKNKNENGKRSRTSPVQREMSLSPATREGASELSPARKKKRTCIRANLEGLKQPKIDMFLNKNKNRDKPEVDSSNDDTLDQRNISHLKALDTSDLNSDISNGEDGAVTCDISKHEPLLFSEPSKINNFWVITKDRKLDSNKLAELLEETRKHNLKLFKSSTLRAKYQVAEGFPDKGNILGKCKGSETLKKRCDLSVLNNHFNEKCPCNSQSDTMAIPSSAKPTWSQARNLASEAIRSHNRGDFYREALQQQVPEYWCLGLEKVPAHLMKVVEFRTELHEMKNKHARELMGLAVKHLDLDTAL